MSLPLMVYLNLTSEGSSSPCLDDPTAVNEEEKQIRPRVIDIRIENRFTLEEGDE